MTSRLLEMSQMSRYSAKFREHAFEPLHRGVMTDPDFVGRAELGGPEQFMTIYLRLSDQVVQRALFQTYACGAAAACGSMLTELITGLNIVECRSLSAQDLVLALDGIPPDKLPLAGLAIAALRAALPRPSTDS